MTLNVCKYYLGANATFSDHTTVKVMNLRRVEVVSSVGLWCRFRAGIPVIIF